MDALHHMMQVCMLVSPTGVEQRGFSSMVQQMQAVGHSDHYIVNALAGALQDGLQHGNWPKEK